MKKSVEPISLAGSQLGAVRHVCAFFNSEDEQYRVLLPFIKDGFECGHKAVHVVNPGQRDDHLQRLAAAGINAAAARESGQFELRTNTETYLRDGRFDQDRMLQHEVDQLIIGPLGISEVEFRVKRTLLAKQFARSDAHALHQVEKGLS